MNRVFKIVFNKARGMFVVGSEHISSHSKGSLKTAVAAVALTAITAMGGVAQADGSIEGIDATTHKKGKTITIIGGTSINIKNRTPQVQPEPDTKIYEIGLTEDAENALKLAKKSDYRLLSQEISEEEKAAGVVSKMALKDNGGKDVSSSHGTFIDTDTKYDLQQSVDEENNQTKISLINANNSKIVNSATIKGDDTVTISQDGETGAKISVKETNYQTDNGKTSVKPGGSLSIKGGSNITTSVEDNEIKVGLKDDIEVKTIKATDKAEIAGVTISNGQIIGDKYAVTNNGGAVLADGKVRVDGDGTVRIGGSGNNANTTLYENGDITSKVGDTTLNVNKGGVSMGNGNTQFVVSKDGASMKHGDNQVAVTKDGVGIAGNTGITGSLAVSENVGVGGNLAVAGDIGAKNITASENVNAKNITASENVNAKNINASESVNVGNTSVKNEGVTIKGNNKNNNSIVFTQDKIDMGNRQIHGVAAGTADTDAVNFAQLKTTEANFNQKLGNMDKHINRVEDNAYAGVAMALATAGLPQAWQPGKSMIAAAAGTYMGEQGYAIGFSHNTENGKWTLKATASGNSQGHFGGTVGAGYMW